MPELGSLTRAGLPQINFKPVMPSDYLTAPPPPLPADTTKASAILGHAAVLNSVAKTIAELPDTFQQAYKTGQQNRLTTAEDQSKLQGLSLKNSILDGSIDPTTRQNLQNVSFGPDGSSTVKVPAQYELDTARAKLEDTQAQSDLRRAQAEKARLGAAGGLPNPYLTEPPLPLSGAAPAALPSDPSDLISTVKNFEGFNPHPYSDHHQTSIGYGTVARPGDKAINEAEATDRLSAELSTHASRVDDAIAKSGATLSPAQRNALVSFDYNTGSGADVITRTGGDPSAMAAEMAKYTHVTAPGGGKVVAPGLVTRRAAEIAMLTQPTAAATPAAPRDDISGVMPGAAPASPIDDDYERKRISLQGLQDQVKSVNADPAIPISQKKQVIADLYKSSDAIVAQMEAIDQAREAAATGAAPQSPAPAADLSSYYPSSTAPGASTASTASPAATPTGNAGPTGPTGSFDPEKAASMSDGGRKLAALGPNGGTMTRFDVPGNPRAGFDKEEAQGHTILWPHYPGTGKPYVEVVKPNLPSSKMKSEAVQMGVYQEGMTTQQIQDAMNEKVSTEGIIPIEERGRYNSWRRNITTTNPIVKAYYNAKHSADVIDDALSGGTTPAAALGVIDKYVTAMRGGAATQGMTKILEEAQPVIERMRLQVQKFTGGPQDNAVLSQNMAKDIKNIVSRIRDTSQKEVEQLRDDSINDWKSNGVPAGAVRNTFNTILSGKKPIDLDSSVAPAAPAAGAAVAAPAVQAPSTGAVKMKAPSGETRYVSPDAVKKYQDLGAVVVE